MREMRMKNRQRDEAFAWEVLRQSVYATLALVKDDGTPIAVPINVVGDEVYKVIYFHCAGVGEKGEILEKNPQVSLSVVSHAAIKPMAFSTAYRSARFNGRAQVVTDEGEMVKALMLLCQHFDPKNMGNFAREMEHCTARVVKIIPEEITGKENM